jgi:hypothetical protein
LELVDQDLWATDLPEDDGLIQNEPKFRRIRLAQNLLALHPYLDAPRDVVI